MLRTRWRIICSLGIVLVVLALGWPSVAGPRTFADTAGYLDFGSARPPGYTLIARALGVTYGLVVFQYVTSIVAWSLFGYLLCGHLGILLLGVFALSQPVLEWNHMVLSESLSVTLAIASFAFVLLLLRNWKRNCFVIWCVIVCLFGLARPTNLFLLPFLGMPFLFRGRKQLISIAVPLLAVFIVGNIHVVTRGAGLQNAAFTQCVMMRVLPSPDRTRAFAGYGMPTNEVVMSFVGKHHLGNVTALHELSPEFGNWMRTKGPGVYKKWIITRCASYTEAWEQLLARIDKVNEWYCADIKLRKISWDLTHLFIRVDVPPVFWVLGLGVPLLSFALMRKLTPISLIVIPLMLGTYVQAFVGFHGDSYGINRHLLLASILYRVAFFVAVCGVVEVFKTFHKGMHSEQVSAPDGAQEGSCDPETAV